MNSYRDIILQHAALYKTIRVCEYLHHTSTLTLTHNMLLYMNVGFIIMPLHIVVPYNAKSGHLCGTLLTKCHALCRGKDSHFMCLHHRA